MNNDELISDLQDLIDRIPGGDLPERITIMESDKVTLRAVRELLIVRANMIEDHYRNIEDKNKRINELKVALADRYTEIASLMRERVSLAELERYIYQAQYAVEMAHQACSDEASFHQIVMRVLDDIQEHFSPDCSGIPF